MRIAAIIMIMLAGMVLALSPMMFNSGSVHPDRTLHAQWAGFILLGCGTVLVFRMLGRDRRGAE